MESNIIHQSGDQIFSEAATIIDRLRHLNNSYHELSRVRDCIISLEKKLIENETKRMELEPRAQELIKLRDQLARQNFLMNEVINVKATLGPIKAAMTWLSTEYPETNQMTLEQLFAYLDKKKSDMIQKQSHVKSAISNLSFDEKKYRNIVQRSERLRTCINEKTRELDEGIARAFEVRKLMDDISLLRKIKTNMKAVLKNELAIQIAMKRIDSM